MTTRKLLWGMTWRGMALGTEYGAVLGFLYGLLILLLVFGLSSIFPSPPPTQIVGEQIELDASVFFIGTLLSSFAGFVVGISTGLTIGLIRSVLRYCHPSIFPALAGSKTILLHNTNTRKPLQFSWNKHLHFLVLPSNRDG